MSGDGGRRLSIVSTLYRSEAHVEEFCRRSVAAAERITPDFEIILVNDGSPDSSYGLAARMREHDPRIVVIDLSRNFGHHKALMTGLAWARGEAVLMIDSDLEEQPELLNVFWERLGRGDCDVVYGYQETRRGGWFRKASGNLFYHLVGTLSDLQLQRNVLVARLMNRDYAKALLRHRDREFMLASLWALTGFRQVGIPVERKTTKKTSYSVHKRIDMALGFLTAYSSKIVYLFLYSGLAISAVAFLFIVYLVGRYALGGIGAEGWTSVMVSIWFFGGVTILLLGLIGTYVSRILIETKRRPYTIIREVLGADDWRPSDNDWC